MAKTKIELYTAGTPNGQKANIVLEELGLDYEVHAIDLGNNQQKEESFLKINRKASLFVLNRHNNERHN